MHSVHTVWEYISVCMNKQPLFPAGNKGNHHSMWAVLSLNLKFKSAACSFLSQGPNVMLSVCYCSRAQWGTWLSEMNGYNWLTACSDERAGLKCFPWGWLTEPRHPPLTHTRAHHHPCPIQCCLIVSIRFFTFTYIRAREFLHFMQPIFSMTSYWHFEPEIAHSF